uniref:Erythrocyte membrane protein 1, PfEMP1 n=1 Tax=Parastrongyloides trichosuri TaxID=131310 RepID=A0A0N4Z3U0_PARTI
MEFIHCQKKSSKNDDLSNDIIDDSNLRIILDKLYRLIVNEFQDVCGKGKHGNKNSGSDNDSTSYGSKYWERIINRFGTADKYNDHKRYYHDIVIPGYNSRLGSGRSMSYENTENFMNCQCTCEVPSESSHGSGRQYSSRGSGRFSQQYY